MIQKLWGKTQLLLPGWNGAGSSSPAPQWFPMGTIWSTCSGAGVEWEHRGQPLEILLERELEAALQLRKHRAPVQRGGQELMSWASSLAAEPAAGPHPLSSDELGSSKQGKGKGKSVQFRSPKLLELFSPVLRRKPRIPLLPKGFLNWNIETEGSSHH